MKKNKIDKDIKLNIDRRRQWRRLRHSVLSRNITRKLRRQNRAQQRRAQWHVEVKAPPRINLYDQSDHERTVDFLRDLRFKISRNSKVRICFRDTRQITAAAGLLFIAELDRLVKTYPGVKFSCVRPPIQHDSKYGTESHLTESVLNHIGFFKLVGLPEKALPIYKNVSCWKKSHGHVAKGEIAGELLSHVDGHLSKHALKRLYRGAIEAISNCVEHAYPSVRPDGLNIVDKRWWMFVGISMDRLTVCVCDLGVGIPATVPKKHAWELIQATMERLNVKGTRDSEWIRVSTEISRSRTDLKHRGKGGKDIRELLEYYSGAKLSIFSNKGCFRDWNRQKAGSKKPVKIGMLDEQKKSIQGTIIEWTVPLEELSN